MVRWIAVLAVLLLAGCASTRPHYYDDGYYADRYDGRYYDDRYVDGGYYDDGYYGDSGYYRGGDGYGDYYYSDRSYRYPSYFESPYYYSLFWPLNRWSYDPYWYPNYYYGVTWFPRNYFSVGLSFGSRWSHWGGFAYSPYRYGWADSYYDWSPWYHRYGYGRHYDRPRFGNAAHEAERLAGLSGRGARSGQGMSDARSSAMRGERAVGRFDGSARSGRGTPVQRATSALPRSDRDVPLRRGRAGERPLRRDGALLRSEAEPGSASARSRVQALRESGRPGAGRAATVRPDAERPLVRSAQPRSGYDRDRYDRAVYGREGYALPRARQPQRVDQRAEQRVYVAPRGSRAPYDVESSRRDAPRGQPAARGYERRVDSGAARPLPEANYRHATQAAAPVYAPPPAPTPAPRRYERSESSEPSYSPAPRARSSSEATRSSRRGRRDDP